MISADTLFADAMLHMRALATDTVKRVPTSSAVTPQKRSAGTTAGLNTFPGLAHCALKHNTPAHPLGAYLDGPPTPLSAPPLPARVYVSALPRLCVAPGPLQNAQKPNFRLGLQLRIRLLHAVS